LHRADLLGIETENPENPAFTAEMRSLGFILDNMPRPFFYGIYPVSQLSPDTLYLNFAWKQVETGCCKGNITFTIC
jgi:hypothetical protein